MTGKPIDYVLSKFSEPKRNGKEWKCRCPAHDDAKPSLSITEAEDGTVLVKCRAHCETSAVLAAVGLTLRDLFTATNGKPKDDTPKTKSSAFATAALAVASIEKQKGKRSALWTYTDAAGEPVGVVVRWDTADGKDIRPVSRYSDGWRVAAMPSPRPLYRLPDLAAAKTIVVTEGEKAADVAVQLGFVATTSAGGSGAAALSDWSPLTGKTVLIVPDNDAPGRKYADSVAAILAKLPVPAAVKIVELPGLPERGDIVDFIAARPDAKPEDLRAEIEKLATAATTKAAPADPDAWTAPTPLPERPPVDPFPIELFPATVRELWQAKADRVNIGVDLIGAMGITALGVAIGRSLAGQIAFGYERSPLFWSAAVAPSGAGKSAAAQTILKPLIEWDREKIQEYDEEMAEFEEKEKCYRAAAKEWKASEVEYLAAMEDWNKADQETKGAQPKREHAPEPPERPNRPVCRLGVLTNFTVETLPGVLRDNDRGVGLIRDEFGSTLRALGQFKGGEGSDRADLLLLWNGEGQFSSTRGGAGERKHIRSDHSFLAMTGCLTPTDIHALASGTTDGKTTRHDGWSERFLVSWPEARKAIPLRRLPSIKHLEESYDSLVRKLLTIPLKEVRKTVGMKERVYLKPTTIESTDAAFHEWSKHDRWKCDLYNARDPDDPFRGWLSKLSHNALAASVMFFALELAEDAQTNGQAIPTPILAKIEDRHVAAAWKLMRYFHSHGLRVWNSGPFAENLHRAKAILGKLKTHGKKQEHWTRREFHRLVDQQSWAAGKPPSELDKPLALLVEYGYIRPVESVRGRGRPTEKFEVNPLEPTLSPDDRDENHFGGADAEKPLENEDFDPANIAPEWPSATNIDRDNIPEDDSLENKGNTNGEPPETNFAPVFDPPKGNSGAKRRRTFGNAGKTAAKGGRA